MITLKHLAAVVGFFFVAMWILTNFGYAILCLIGAAIFYAAASFMQGELDVGAIQSRFGIGGPGQSASTAPPPPPPTRSRVVR